MKIAALVILTVALLNVLSWAVIGRDQALLATARFYGEGCHGSEDSVLVFAHYRGFSDNVLQAGDFSARTRNAFIAEVRERRRAFLDKQPGFEDSEGIVEYRDSVGDKGAESESTARFIPLVDRSGFLNIEASGAETLSDGSMYATWSNRYWWLFGWRSLVPDQVGCA